jgi:hypothetical protein
VAFIGSKISPRTRLAPHLVEMTVRARRVFAYLKAEKMCAHRSRPQTDSINADKSQHKKNGRQQLNANSRFNSI